MVLGKRVELLRFFRPQVSKTCAASSYANLAYECACLACNTSHALYRILTDTIRKSTTLL